MNIWHDVSAERIHPDDFLTVIEISKGSKNKYELDKQTGCLILDRVLYTSTHYPANYGFIPRTFCDDNDPLDVLVLCSEPIVPLGMVRAYPIGMVTMMDDGYVDNKIIAIPFKDPSWCGYKEIEDLPGHIMQEICHFFTVYKTLENKQMAVMKIENRQAALDEIAKCIQWYKDKFLPGR